MAEKNTGTESNLKITVVKCYVISNKRVFNFHSNTKSSDRINPAIVLAVENIRSWMRRLFPPTIPRTKRDVVREGSRMFATACV